MKEIIKLKIGTCCKHSHRKYKKKDWHLIDHRNIGGMLNQTNKSSKFQTRSTTIKNRSSPKALDGGGLNDIWVTPPGGEHCSQNSKYQASDR